MGIQSKLSGFRRLVANANSVRQRHGIGFLTQWREYNFFSRRLGFERVEFYCYGLWDTTRPARDRLTMLSNLDRRAIERRMNLPSARKKADDKVWATDVLVKAGVPVAPVLGLVRISPDTTPSSDNFPLHTGPEELKRLLGSAPSEGVVFKPFDGGGGRSVQVFKEVSEDGMVHLDGTEWSFETLLNTLREERLWIVERRLEPHPRMADIAGPTLGTLRMTSIRLADGTIHLGPAVWKVPIGDSGLDHFTHGQGQMAAPIDAQSGVVGAGRFFYRIDVIERHPLTGKMIAGSVIPYWKEACELVMRAAEYFPDLGSIGFDIAIAEEGPMVIEINTTWAAGPVQAGWQKGLVQGHFLTMLEQLGADDVIRPEVRGLVRSPSR